MFKAVGPKIYLPERYTVLLINNLFYGLSKLFSRKVFMENLLVHVVLLEDVVSHEPARLPLSGDICYPAEFAPGVVSLSGEMVLEETPVGIDHEEAIVTDPFEILYLVEVHSGLPCPFAHLDLLAVLLIEFHSV